MPAGSLTKIPPDPSPSAMRVVPPTRPGSAVTRPSTVTAVPTAAARTTGIGGVEGAGVGDGLGALVGAAVGDDDGAGLGCELGDGLPGSGVGVGGADGVGVAVGVGIAVGVGVGSGAGVTMRSPTPPAIDR